jgi:hypothetical protein
MKQHRPELSDLNPVLLLGTPLVLVTVIMVAAKYLAS